MEFLKNIYSLQILCMRKVFTLSFIPFSLDTAYLILRLSFGLLMMTHGYDKLQNFLSGSAEFPDPLGVGARTSLGLTVFAEFFCSGLLVLGAFTRLALVPLIICALVIVFSIHKADPLGDKEHGLLYLFVYLSLFLTGAGKYSIDHYLWRGDAA